MSAEGRGASGDGVPTRSVGTRLNCSRRGRPDLQPPADKIECDGGGENDQRGEPEEWAGQERAAFFWRIDERPTVERYENGVNQISERHRDEETGGDKA